jgi:hypothetical protein
LTRRVKPQPRIAKRIRFRLRRTDAWGGQECGNTYDAVKKIMEICLHKRITPRKQG